MLVGGLKEEGDARGHGKDSHGATSFRLGVR